MDKNIFAGIDIGSSRTKVVLLDSVKNIIGYSVRKSGSDFSNTAKLCLDDSLKMAEMKFENIVRTVSTGYGKNNVEFADFNKTEISCHAKGCYHYFPEALSIIDIGGQDNKIIKLDATGKRTSFKMNRKCAAGTGAFLEEMAMRLDVQLEDMNRLAESSNEMVKIGSYCTVFSATEVLENIRKGKKVSDLAKGLFYSVLKRVLEMDSLEGRVVMTGGVVAYNPILVKMAGEELGVEILVAEYPQLTGAIGAALYALEKEKDNELNEENHG
jgi:predicted CoA-substrate-specific enzyme activase